MIVPGLSFVLLELSMPGYLALPSGLTFKVWRRPSGATRVHRDVTRAHTVRLPARTHQCVQAAGIKSQVLAGITEVS